VTTDTLIALLGSLARLEADLGARLDARTDQVRSELSHLRRSLDETLRTLEAHATARQARPLEDLDAERIRTFVSAGRLDELSSREARYVILSFLEFPSHRLAELLEVRPILRRAFARQTLLRWELSITHPDWESYAEVLEQLSPSESPIDAPLPLRELAGRQGAANAASVLRADTLAEAHRTIVEDWRLQPSWTLTPHALVEWMRRRLSTHEGLSGPVKEFLRSDGEPLRALLLPLPAPIPSTARTTTTLRPTRTALTQGSLVVQIRAVATLLEARFSQRPSIDEATFAAVEPALLRSTFGDPRTVTTSDAWSQVRTLCTQPYDAFLQGLVREDLALFFRHLMRADDRERFWLQYLGSIRRTVCVLDRDAYSALDHKLTGAAEAIRAALARVIRTRSGNVDDTCAFCLFFDNFVMVEFSVVGNAGYLYDRQDFEREFLARMHTAQLESPAALKNRSSAKFRLLHHRGWQDDMALELLKRGVRADRRTGRHAS
jgi:EH_Signature domain